MGAKMIAASSFFGGISSELPAHAAPSARLSGGDVDADAQNAWSAGDEAVGGSTATPDQDVVDELGEALGIGQAAMEAAVRYAKERSAFGQPIAAFQAIQFLLADMSAGLEGARLLLRRAAFLKDQGRPILREAAEVPKG